MYKPRAVTPAPPHSTSDNFCMPPTIAEHILFIYKNNATHLAGYLWGVNQMKGLTVSGTIPDRPENRWQESHLRSQRIFSNIRRQFGAVRGRLGQFEAGWGSLGIFPPFPTIQFHSFTHLFIISESTLERITLNGTVSPLQLITYKTLQDMTCPSFNSFNMACWNIEQGCLKTIHFHHHRQFSSEIVCDLPQCRMTS